MTQLYKFSCNLSVIFICFSSFIAAQTSIDWQQSIGTQWYDNALKIFNDAEGNIVIVGQEPHQDLTGDLRTYMVISKIDAEGHEIWKQYHDVAYETQSIPLDYYFGEQFYTLESGQKLINLVTNLSGRLLIYKLLDENGEYYSYEEIESPLLTVDEENAKVHARATCSIQQACYGPDSLIVQKVNPVADSLFNFIAWTFGVKQNIRTTPIQGHYDFSNNDIATDEDGNVYLLTQIERWDFQFCTDCNDIFIDGYSMLYKFNAKGEEIKHVRLNITSAVVSALQFLSVSDGQIVVRETDINNAGTDLLTTVYRMNYDLVVQEEFVLDKHYNHVVADANGSIYTVTNVYDANDPNIKGESDVLVSKFSNEGVLEWKSYYGGSSFDFPKGFVLTSDGGIAFFANTESTDFDIEENHGYQDMWLVKLSENLVGVDDGDKLDFSFYPNPASDFIRFDNDGVLTVSIYDLTGKEIIRDRVEAGQREIMVNGLNGGSYFMRVVTEDGDRGVFKLVKM